MFLRTRPIGESDLIFRDGNWYLHATIEVPEATPSEPLNGFLGVDMGVVNIATTSTGEIRLVQVELLPQATVAVTKTVAGQEDHLSEAVAQEAAPQRGTLCDRFEPQDLEMHRDRG